MHKDLSNGARREIEQEARDLVEYLKGTDQSVAIARQAFINALDEAASA